MNNFYSIIKNGIIVSVATFMNELDFSVFQDYSDGIETFSIANGDYATVQAEWNGDGSTITIDQQVVSYITINSDTYYIAITPDNGGQWED